MADPLSITASIISLLQLTKSTAQYLRTVKDASKDCKRLALEICSVRGILSELSDRFDNEVEGNEGAYRNETAPWFATLQRLGEPDGPFQVLDTALRELNLTLEESSSATRMMKLKHSFLWPFTKAQTEELLRIIERQKSLLGLSLDNDQFLLSKAIKEDTSTIRHGLRSIHEELSALRSGIAGLKLHQHHDNTQKILDWIAPTSFVAAHTDISSRRKSNLGTWFLNSSEYRRWTSGSERILLCTGIPGAGKTYLASLIIDDLRTTVVSSDKAIVVAWLYFNYTERRSQTVASLLRSLLRQLAQSLPEIPSEVQSLHNLYKDKDTPPSITEIRLALMGVARMYDCGYIVVDALDECEESDGTRTSFAAELMALPTNLQLLVTSRPVESIKEDFAQSIQNEIAAREEDIENYVLIRLHEERKLAKYVRGDAGLQSRIQEAVVKKCQGMFLMAKLHLDALARKAKYSKNAFLEAIDRLPKELDGTYHDALQRISNQETEDVELAMQVLCWVWQACEPLTLLQLQQVISIQQGHPNDERDHYIEPTLLVSVCAGLVVLSEEAQVVRLVHYTAVDYFQRHQSRYFPDSGIQVSFTCLSHLDKVLEMIDMKMWDGPDPSLPQDYFNAIVDFNKQDQEQHFGQNTFSRYAVLHMVEHLRHHLTKHQHPGLFKETKRLWVQSSKLHSLRKIYSHLRGVKYFMGKGDKGTLHALELFPEFSGLQLAVLFGLHSEVDRFLDLSRHSTIQSDSHQGQALCISAFYGDYRTLKQLLDAGTKLSYAYEIYPGQSWTALECAIARGHTSIVTYLLNVSRNVIDLRSDKKESLLHFAIMQGSLNQSLNGIVQAILDHGAEINSRSSEGQTPLHYAIIKNKNGSLLPVLRSLLEGGADVNAQDVYGFTPLTWAKKTNNSIAAEVLTRQGALASLEESLITTIETGTPAVLGDLITKGVNITVLKYDNSSNFHDSTGLTALQVAIKRYCTAGEMDSPAQLESLEIFEAILASDIDRNVCGPKGTALHTACTWASMSTHLVKALLEKVSTMLILFTRG